MISICPSLLSHVLRYLSSNTPHLIKSKVSPFILRAIPCFLISHFNLLLLVLLANGCLGGCYQNRPIVIFAHYGTLSCNPSNPIQLQSLLVIKLKSEPISSKFILYTGIFNSFAILIILSTYDGIQFIPINISFGTADT